MDMDVHFRPFTCWFNPKPCTGAASCLNWKILISRGVQKGTGTAAGQQRKAFPTLNLGVLVLGGIKLMSEKSKGRFAKGLLLC